MFMCSAEAPDKPAPDSAIVCIMIAASVMPRPAPPYSSGMAMPSQPASAKARWKSCGKAAVAVLAQPVVVAEARADFLDRVADRLLLGGKREIHGASCARVATRRFYSSTAMALISIRYSGEVILVISTMVEAGAGALKYSRRTLWIFSKCSMLRT